MNERKLFQGIIQKGKIKNKKLQINFKIAKIKSKNKSGITLIALVISIIVMIILAGVSLNATIGDNGIITQAQNAMYTQSAATLEEYINQYYVEHYDEFTDTANKALALKNYFGSSTWFYQGAPLGYVVDSDGNSHYFINIDGLPNDIKKYIKGGKANGKPQDKITYQDYAKMIDVYGVTKDLKVYYCRNGKDSINGVVLDKADTSKEIFAAGSPMAKLINGTDTKNLTLEDLKSVKNLTIENNQVTDFKNFYALVSLQKLTIKNSTLENLEGIENAVQLNYIFFDSSSVKNYSAIGKIGNRLNYLYLYDIDNKELENLCSKEVGIGDYDLPNLKYLALLGSKEHINSTTSYNISYYEGKKEHENIATRTGKKELNNIECLNNLTEITKKAVMYLSLQCNFINSLHGLENFSNLVLLRAEKNKLENLNGIENCIKLENLIVPYNNLNSLTEFSSNSNLNTICLIENKSLNSLKGVKNCKKLEYIFSQRCDLGKNLEQERDYLEDVNDSLYDLKEISTLKWIDLDSNSNLLYVQYLNNNQELNYLRLTSCNRIIKNSIYNIKNLIKKIGIRAYIPTGYSMALLDEENDILDLSNQIISESDFELIGNYIKITKLSLKNIKIVDNNSKEIKNIDEVFNKVLSKLSKMQYLQLYGCNKLTNINFIENMNDLKELDIRDTNVNDLSLIEKKKNNGTMNLGCLAVNTAIDLSCLSNTISGFNGNRWDYWNSVDNTRHGGLLCQSDEAWATLNGTDITSLKVHNKSSGKADLTLCNKLNTVVLEGDAVLQLPKCLTRIEGMNYATPILCKGSDIDYIEIFGGSFDNMFEQLKKVNTIKKIDFSYGTLSKLNNITNLEGKNIKEIKIYITYSSTCDGKDFKIPSTVTSLKLTTGVNDFKINNMPKNILSENGTSLEYLQLNKFNLNSAEFVEDLTLLKSIDLSENNINELPNLEKLKNLNTLKMSDCLIKDVYKLRNISWLNKLDLSNNSIYDTSTIFDESNNKININNLEILANLNKLGNLRTLYLSGNNGITNWEALSKITNWTEKSGW